MGTIGDADRLALAFGVGLGSRDGDDQTLVLKPDVLAAEGYQFAAAEGAGESHEQEGAVAQGAEVFGPGFGGEHLAQEVRGNRVLAVLGGAFYSTDAGQDRAHELVLGGIGESGELMGLGDGGQVALNGVGFQAAGGVGSIGGDGRRGGGQGRDFPALAENFETNPIRAVSLDGIGGFGLADVGLGLGEVWGEEVGGWNDVSQRSV